MRLRADIFWRTDGAHPVPLDPRLVELLRALRHHTTLRGASEESGLSYRAAWGLLLEGAALAGAPLTELERGRGARLTPYGAQLVRSDERARLALAPIAERLCVSPGRATGAAGLPLRLVASHDPLLAELCERFGRPEGWIDEVSFRGSEAGLALYARGGADVAGFHVADGNPASALLRLLKARRDRLVRFAGRQQGLIVARGNPKKLASLADVAGKRARFVNRQKGSGTRLLIDRLLGEAGVAAEQVRGYNTEEYTHLAVAATIAAGRADAGFGVRAAAAQLRLDFIPVLHERYWLAIRERSLAGASARRLLDALAGKPLARIARGFEGYDLEGAGTVFTLAEALGPS